MAAGEIGTGTVQAEIVTDPREMIIVSTMGMWEEALREQMILDPTVMDAVMQHAARLSGFATEELRRAAR